MVERKNKIPVGDSNSQPLWYRIPVLTSVHFIT